MSPPIHFSPLGSVDATRVSRLQRKLFARELTESEQEIREILRNTEMHMVCNFSFGLFDGNAMVGYVFAYIETESVVYRRKEEVLYIKEIALTPGYERFLRPLVRRLLAQRSSFAPRTAIEAHAQPDALAKWQRLKRLFHFYGLKLTCVPEASSPGRPAYQLLRLDFVQAAAGTAERAIPLPDPPSWASGSLNINVVTEPRQWLSLKETWNDLLRQTNDSNVFQSFEYLWEWWKHFGIWNDLYVLVIRKDGLVIGVVPLMVEYFRIFRRTMRKLLFISAPMEMSRPKLILGAHSVECLPALLEHLECNASDWDILDIDEQHHDLKVQLAAHFRGKGHLVAESRTVCPYIDLSGTWGQFLQARSKKMRSNVNRIRKRISALGEISIRTVDSESALAQALDTHCEIEERSWKAENLLSISDNKASYFFYRGLCATFGKERSFVFRILECDGKPLASTFGILKDGVFQSIKIAHDSQYDNLSPGTVLESYELEAFFTEGIRRYEFMGSFLSNKLRWTSAVYETTNVHVYRRQARLMLFYFLHFVFKRWVTRLLEKSGQFERVNSILSKLKYNPFPRY